MRIFRGRVCRSRRETHWAVKRKSEGTFPVAQILAHSARRGERLGLRTHRQVTLTVCIIPWAPVLRSVGYWQTGVPSVDEPPPREIEQVCCVEGCVAFACQPLVVTLPMVTVTPLDACHVVPRSAVLVA